MAKAKYRYNPHTLSYDKIELTLRDKMMRSFVFLGAGLVIGVMIYGLAYTFIDSPKEKQLKSDNAQMLSQYVILNKKLEQLAIVMKDVQHRDDNIYRVIFEAEPIAEDIRKAGFGGVNRYKELEGYNNSELIIKTAEKLDMLSKQLYIQSKSFDEVFEMAKKKEEMLAALPAIQPVQTERIHGYGNRMHPVLKYVKFHAGMDFTAPTGTPIYATGNGKVIKADRKMSGYGNLVKIDHGYNYVTFYAHMSKINCKVGQKVKRGDVIGYVGNTGLSSGPHCHYEVRKNGNPVNPVNYYYNDLTPAEYAKMVEMANSPSQSMD
ncbi:MAG: M23 family metallopeptidase [Flavobacteriales bacterium]|nr:M23 family metallopeptidase [Flavobacteriales bacterium]